ncbi:transferase hexapeptide (six repeat-containing protein) [Desulforhopalus singaporensis]|uniref:Transferase hexapeptide (Six repeat-containing protein) n=1 Tax=Desulforhopalus singaporensis TaxID=91360 RepID=A0A1H0UXL1_9BACT|nr:transferase hexapeptide (six repeat-containing protein) [Desulforhopalus singaporensis]
MLAMWVNPIKYYSRKGAKIGENCRWYSKAVCTEPFLLEIGDHVHIGSGVQLITHDGALWVLREKLGRPGLDRFGKIVVGNNVFIGNNSILMPGVTIGNDCIIGAGSVVTKDVSSGMIAAGIPAKKIGTVDAFADRYLPDCFETKDMAEAMRRKMILEALP